MNRKPTSKTRSKKHSQAPRSHKTAKNLKLFTAKQLVQFFLLWLVPFLILMSFFLSEVLRNDNYLEIFPNELILPTILHAITAFFFAVVLYFIKKPALLPFKLVSATVIGLMMVNYEDRLMAVLPLIKSLLPVSPAPPNDTALASVVFILGLTSTSILVGRWAELKIKKSQAPKLTNISVAILVLVGFIFLSQGIRVAYILPSMIQQSRFEEPALERTGSNDKHFNKPDIYYIVLDRYTNNEVLKSQLGFDNYEFAEYLRTKSFYVNEKAYSNYPGTMSSLSSTLNARYTHDINKKFEDSPIQSRTLYHNLVRKSSVIKALKNEGYEIHNIGSEYGATNKAPLADFEHTFQQALFLGERRIKILRGIEVSTFKKTPFYQFSKMNLGSWSVSLIEVNDVEFIRSQFKFLNSLAEDKTPGGRFIFAHILVPHPPYFFNADGSASISPGVDSIGKVIKQKYIEQVQFSNHQLQHLIDKIHKNAQGEAIILLNSDEGPFPNYLKSEAIYITDEDSHSEDPTLRDVQNWSSDWLKMKYGIQQAVYMPGVQDDITHLSSVNLFRILLNKYFHYNLDYLPECYYSLEASREYSQQDITKKITGNHNSNCDIKPKHSTVTD